MKHLSKSAKTAITAGVLLVASAVVWSSIGSTEVAEQRSAEEWPMQQLGHVNARSVGDLFPLGH
jgi:hypothetical protein